MRSHATSTSAIASPLYVGLRHQVLQNHKTRTARKPYIPPTHRV
ncbi:hypothetical protein [Allocoleopsis sp.]